MVTKHITLVFQAIVITVFMVITLSVYAQSEPVIAYMVNYDCGEFFDGIATIQESSDSYFFINRKGEKIGEAPGKMIHSDSKCTIFENSNYHILTDKNNQVIIKSKDEIQPIIDGLYYISPTMRPGKLVDYNGKTLKEYDNLPRFFTHKGSSEIIVDYFTEINKNGNTEYESFCDVYNKGEYVFTGHDILRDNLAPNYPFIFYYTYNSKTKKNDTMNAYIKSNNKCIELDKPYVSYIPGTNFFINYGKNAHAPEDYIYFDRRGEIIPFEAISHNSHGNHVVYDKAKKKYCLIDNDGNILFDELIQEVDPYLWQSGVIAAKVNNKWGYLDESGEIFLPFEYKNVGPLIGGIGGVIKDNEYQFIYFDDKKGIKSITAADIRKINGWLHSYYVDVIDGYKVLIWKREGGDLGLTDPVYGFYNLFTLKGVDNLKVFPQFEDGIALSYYGNEKGNGNIGCILSLEGEIKARTEGGNYFKKLGENLYYYNKLDKESFNVISYIYSKTGKLLYNSKSSGVILNGKFHNGVAPFSIHGGIDVNGKHYFNGYIYNTFTSDVENVVMNYGSMGQDDFVSLYKDNIKARIELLDYYQILGNKALEKNNYLGAINYFDKALKINSIHDQSNFGMGIAYISLGEYDKALQYLRYVQSKIAGKDYAKALCYYNLGNYDKAEYFNSHVKPSDPSYNQSLELNIHINNALDVKQIEKNESGWDKAFAILSAISNGLQLFSQTMNTIQSSQKSYTPAPSYNYNSSNTSTRKTCSSCHGTGFNSAKERAAFYSYSEETYSNSPCEVCGDRDSHYHKPCPVCMGKRYTNY